MLEIKENKIKKRSGLAQIYSMSSWILMLMQIENIRIAESSVAH